MKILISLILFFSSFNAMANPAMCGLYTAQLKGTTQKVYVLTQASAWVNENINVELKGIKNEKLDLEVSGDPTGDAFVGYADISTIIFNNTDENKWEDVLWNKLINYGYTECETFFAGSPSEKACGKEVENVQLLTNTDCWQ